MTMAARRLRILSVEDEPLNRALLRAVLDGSADARLREAELVEATTLAEGRMAAEAGDHDVVLLDRRLPDGDGFSLVPELRRGAAGEGPIVIALTADAVPATRAAAADAGCTELMIKPYVAAELTGLISGLLDRDARQPRR